MNQRVIVSYEYYGLSLGETITKHRVGGVKLAILATVRPIKANGGHDLKNHYAFSAWWFFWRAAARGYVFGADAENIKSPFCLFSYQSYAAP